MSPVVVVACAFAVGVVLGEFCYNTSTPPTALAAALVFLVGGVWSYLKGKRGSYYFLPLFFMAMGCSWAGMGKVPFPPSLEPFVDHYVRVEGVVAAAPAFYPNRMVLVLDDPVVVLGAEEWRGPGKIQVVFYSEKGDFSPEEAAQSFSAEGAGILPGDRVRAEGTLRLPSTAQDEGEFDYRAYLARRGILAELRALYLPQVLPQREKGLCYLLKRGPALARLRLADGIREALPRDQSLFLEGILFGSREGITADDREIYQRTGVMHLFSVSGLHVGFIFAFLLALSGMLRLGRGASFLLVASGVWGYAAVIDFAPPVTRAAVMATVGLGAHYCRQRKDHTASLALAALAVLLADPAALFEPGFQLSFAATWGILYLAAPLGDKLPFPPLLREMVTVPVTAQLATLPLTALYFQQVAVLGLLANVLVVPLAGLALFLGIAGAVLALAAPAAGSPFLVSAGALSYPIKWLVGLAAGIPGAAFAVPHSPWWVVAVWFLLLVLFGWSLQHGFTVSFPHFRFRSFPSRWTLPSFCGLVLCLLFMCWVPGCRSQQLEVTFLDVGQGDAVLVRTPGGRSMLIDAGGSPTYGSSTFDPGREIVVPALWRAGIRRLDLVVNSHPHEDHLGGIPAVLRNVQVGGFVVPPLEHPTPLTLEVQRLLREKGIPVYQIRAGAQIRLDPALRIAVLGPPERLYRGTRSDLNNNSLVLHLVYGEVSFLLTGDLEQEGMAGLAAAAKEGRLQGGLAATVLKAPHHGSPYSTCPEFADAVRPQVVVISVGRNSFGHPAPSTIRFWEERGARVLRTDEAGTITFRTDGKRLEIRGLEQ